VLDRLLASSWAEDVLTAERCCLSECWTTAVLQGFKPGDPFLPLVTDRLSPADGIEGYGEVGSRANHLPFEHQSLCPSSNDIRLQSQLFYWHRHLFLHRKKKIYILLAEGGVVGVVFLYLKKAFDIVSQSILLSKLHRYNVSSGTLQ